MKPLRPQPGSTIDPANAIGRQATRERARNELREGNNLSLNDPRRMGKTVWLDLFSSNPGEGFEVVKIDYEGIETAEEFLVRTVAELGKHRSLPSQAVTKLKALFNNIEVTGGPITVRSGVSTRSPTELLEDVIREVEGNLADDLLFVIAMDEVPIAIKNVAHNEGPAPASHLLQTLRGLRRGGSGLRWIVSGSVGFHHVLRLCDATEGAVNDLVNLPLGPLEVDDASELAERLLLGINRAPGEGAVEALVESSGGIPFLIHALAHRLDDGGTGPVFAKEVADSFVDFVADRDESRAVTHLLTRLDLLYGDQTDAAEAILDRVALEGPSVASDLDAERRLLDSLIDDHYLVERHHAEGPTVSWRYDVLRRIWIQRRRLV